MDWLRERKRDQLNHLLAFIPEDANCHWIASSSDWGVVRNGGRRGTAHGPEAIKATYFKFSKHNDLWKYFAWEVASQEDEKLNFPCAQERESLRIQQIFQRFPYRPTIHLGGGHDHAYPLLAAFLRANPTKNVHVINIDAHLDTRQDEQAHSGTPFRQLLEEFPQRLRISQVGIHTFSNAPSNYQTSEPMEVYTLEEIESYCPGMIPRMVYQWAETNLLRRDSEVQFLSLDCDGLHSNIMEAVSAVNPQGLSIEAVQTLFQFYRDYNNPSEWMIGLYEMNPLYDNLSQKGARAVSSLIYNTFYEKPDKSSPHLKVID